MGACGSKQKKMRADGKAASGGGLGAMASGMLPKFDIGKMFMAKILMSPGQGSMFDKAKAAITGAYPKAKVEGETTQKPGTFDIMAKGKTLFSKSGGDGDFKDSSKLGMLQKLFGAVQGGATTGAQANPTPATGLNIGANADVQGAMPIGTPQANANAGLKL